MELPGDKNEEYKGDDLEDEADQKMLFPILIMSRFPVACILAPAI